VLELSSFQLDGVSGFEPSAATVLNLTQDHLDWHGDMPSYGAAKARIFGDTGLLVLNRDDPAVMAMLPEPVRIKLQKPKWRNYATFGVGMPQRPGDFGIETVNGMAWLVRAAEADETIKRRKDEEVELHVQRLMPVDALRIRGRHNATNALAALALAGSVGVSLAPMLHALREYSGEPHRVASVAVIRDVEYFDDSKGTNVGATVAALAGLGTGRKLADCRWGRQGPGLLATGRSGAQLCARRCSDRARCPRDCSGSRRLGRPGVACRFDGSGRPGRSRPGADRRCRADVARLCQLGHVRELRATRPGVL
jgi:UDP-N-acetylmuramoylalanine-D-glutamate ligase